MDTSYHMAVGSTLFCGICFGILQEIKSGAVGRDGLINFETHFEVFRGGQTEPVYFLVDVLPGLAPDGFQAVAAGFFPEEVHALHHLLMSQYRSHPPLRASSR